MREPHGTTWASKRIDAGIYLGFNCIASHRNVYLSSTTNHRKSGSSSASTTEAVMTVALFQCPAPSQSSIFLFRPDSYPSNSHNVFLPNQIHPVSRHSRNHSSFGMAIHPPLHFFKKVHGLGEFARGLFSHHGLLMCLCFVEPGV